ncbi:MAG: pilin [Microgenomates group bacterium]
MPTPTQAPEGIYNPVIKETIGRGSGADILARLIANFLKITFSVTGLVLLAMLLWGGIQWMTAGGDKEQMTKAQGRITSALIGFVIFMSVFAIINFIAPALGLEFLQILKIEWPTP